MIQIKFNIIAIIQIITLNLTCSIFPYFSLCMMIICPYLKSFHDLTFLELCLFSSLRLVAPLLVVCLMTSFARSAQIFLEKQNKAALRNNIRSGKNEYVWSLVGAVTIHYRSKSVQAQIEVFRISIFYSDEVVPLLRYTTNRHNVAPRAHPLVSSSNYGFFKKWFILN